MQRIAKVIVVGLILLSAFNIVKAQATDPGVELNQAQPAKGHGAREGEWEVIFEPVETRYLRLSAITSSDGGNRLLSVAEMTLASADNAEALDRSRWQVVPSIQSASGHSPAQILDGREDTFWLSMEGALPHHLDFDLGEKVSIAGLRYLPRQDGQTAGTVAEFSLAVSEDGSIWKDPILRGVLVPEKTAEDELASDVPVPVELDRTTFATHGTVFAPVAIALDEQNRVFVAETYRYEGRGVIDNRGKERRERDDLQTHSLEDRLKFLAEWEADGELRGELRKRRSEFRPGDDFFTKYSEKIALLQDLDGDGVADQRTVYAEGFNGKLDGAGAGVLVGNGAVYYTCIPHVWKLWDHDGDGRADERSVLSRGYGVRTGWYGHDLHGLTWGPDGRLYFSMADRGFNVTTQEGRVLYGPGTGGVFRCWPDGSELELFAQGLRNPQELAFDDFGNLFTGDNNCDAGDQARLVYVVPGGDSGWNMSVQSLEHRGPWLRESMWEEWKGPEDLTQPAWILPPVDYLNSGPSGFAYYPGTGLPPDYKGYFFLCDYRGGSGSIRSFRVEPKGAWFEMKGHHGFDDGPSVADMTFGYDGKVYVAEWGPGWDINANARIYTLSHPASREESQAREVEQWFAQGFDSFSAGELSSMLGHVDQRVRLRAQFTLVEKGDPTPFEAVLESEASVFARLHATWGLGQMARTSPDVAARLLPLLDDPEPEIRGQALKLCGELKLFEAGEDVLLALQDPNPRVRFFAAYAAGGTAPEGATESLVQLLRDTDNQDPYLRHAAVQGLISLRQPDSLLTMTEDSNSDAVRLGVVLTLRGLDDVRVSQFLNDPSPLVATEAARAIYDREMMAALPELAVALDSRGRTEPLINEAFLRRALEANFRMGTVEAAERLAAFALNADMPILYRERSLKLLTQWDNPPEREGVWGKWRPVAERGVGLARTVVRDNLEALLQLERETLREHALKLDNLYGQEKTPDQLFEIASDEKAPENQRIDALMNLEKRKSDFPARFSDLCEVILNEQGVPKLTAEAIQIWVREKGEEALPRIQEWISSDVNALVKQSAVNSLASVQTEQASELIRDYVRQLSEGSLDPQIQLEVFQLGQNSSDTSTREYVVRYESQQATENGLSALSMEGGQVDKGQQIYQTNLATQCMRCHALNGVGGDVGPALDGLASRRSAKEILRSLMEPQADITPGYGHQTVTMKDGSLVSGLLVEENQEFVVIQVDSQPQSISLEKVEERSPLISGMPPMGLLLKPNELRDLMAFLQSLD